MDEITDQVLYFQQLGHKIDSISFMGKFDISRICF